jgi:hypothetical protein
VACLGGDGDLLAGHSSGGQRSTPVTMTIQTVNQQTAHSAKPILGGPLGSMAIAFLLLPMAGIKPVRNRLRAAAVVGPKGYTVAVNGTDTIKVVHNSTNITFKVQ